MNLRQIPHHPIRVPPNLPRPLLKRLSISHRRIPIIALGRDIYIDTRLILSKLETLIPDSPKQPRLGAKTDFERGFEEMLEAWTIDAGPFWRMAGCIPPQAPLLQDEVWVKDRAEGSGGGFTLETLKKGRPWCISQARIYFGVMEKLLGDGRQWILGDKVGLADVHGCWVFDWGINMAGDIFVVDEDKEAATGDMAGRLGPREFPRIHEWVGRFRTVCEKAEKENEGARVCGEGSQAEDEVVRKILSSGYAEPEELPFEVNDVLGLEKGQRVSVAPVDFGAAHADTGVLVGLSRNEVVIEVEVQGGRDKKLRLHFPRIDFRIVAVAEKHE